MATLVVQKGVVLVDTMEELIDTAEMLARFPVPSRHGAAVITNSGAFKGFALDFCESIGLALANPSPATLAQLGKALPSFATVENPLDVTGQVIKEPAILANTMGPLLADPEVGSVLVAVVPGGPKQATDKADALLPVLKSAAKPVAMAVMGDEVALPAGYSNRLRDENVAFFRSPERALRALAHVTRCARNQTNPAGAAPRPTLPAVDLPGPGVLPEYAAKAIISRIGIAVPKGALARSVAEAARIAAGIGFPVVLKAQSSALAHKSEAGGVLIDITDDAALKAGWERLQANVRATHPDLTLDGVLVEAMSPSGVELMIGGKRDAQWGVVLTVGLGGVWVEALCDVQLLAPGCTAIEIRDRIVELRASALLGRFRGQPPRDIAALTDAIERVDALMTAYPAIKEIDINPIVIHAEDRGVVALDALIVIGE
jgi:acyl-CoA synthetase (NDP forming)